MPKLSLKALADLIQAQLQGDEACEITGVAPLGTAKFGQISFLSRSKYRQELRGTQASAVILNASDAPMCPTNALVTENPELAFINVVQKLVTLPKQSPGIDPTATIDPTSKVHSTASIGVGCYIGANVVIEKNVKIAPGCVISENCHIGSDSILWASVVLYHSTVMGERVILHSGVVLGADGFGLLNDRGSWVKVPQVGNVVIGNDVEIGANTTIDRGTLDDTIIGNGVKLDNLIQIAHNVKIGEHTVIAACTCIGGSTKIGKQVMIGGCSVLSNQLVIADNVILTGGTTVAHSINEPGTYSSGITAGPNKMWRKNVARFHYLNDMALRLKTLEGDFAMYLKEKVDN